MACPLCGKVPESIFHIILNCELVSTIWEDIRSLLLRLHPVQPNEEEKAFGIVHKKPPPGIRVRNWLTFLIRRFIAKMERRAHYCNSNILAKTRKKIQHCIEKNLTKSASYVWMMEIWMFLNNFSHTVTSSAGKIEPRATLWAKLSPEISIFWFSIFWFSIFR